MYVAVEGESDQKSGALRIPQIGEEPLPHGALQGQSAIQYFNGKSNWVASWCPRTTINGRNMFLPFTLIHHAAVCSPSSVPTMKFLGQDLSQLFSTKPHAQRAHCITHFVRHVLTEQCRGNATDPIFQPSLLHDCDIMKLLCAVDAMPKLAHVSTDTEAVPEYSMDSPRSTTSAMSGKSMTSQGTPRSPFRRAVGYAEAAVGLTGQYLPTLTPCVDTLIIPL